MRDFSRRAALLTLALVLLAPASRAVEKAGPEVPAQIPAVTPSIGAPALDPIPGALSVPADIRIQQAGSPISAPAPATDAAAAAPGARIQPEGSPNAVSVPVVGPGAAPDELANALKAAADPSASAAGSAQAGRDIEAAITRERLIHSSDGSSSWLPPSAQPPLEPAQGYALAYQRAAEVAARRGASREQVRFVAATGSLDAVDLRRTVHFQFSAGEHAIYVDYSVSPLERAPRLRTQTAKLETIGAAEPSASAPASFSEAVKVGVGDAERMARRALPDLGGVSYALRSSNAALAYVFYDSRGGQVSVDAGSGKVEIVSLPAPKTSILGALKRAAKALLPKGPKLGVVPQAPKTSEAGPVNALHTGVVRETLPNPGDLYEQAYELAVQAAASKGAARENVHFAGMTSSIPAGLSPLYYRFFIADGAAAATGTAIFVDFSTAWALPGQRYGARVSIHQNAPLGDGSVFPGLSAADYVRRGSQLAPEAALAQARNTLPELSSGVSLRLSYRRDEAGGDVDLWYDLYDSKGNAVSVNARTGEARVMKEAAPKPSAFSKLSASTKSRLGTGLIAGFGVWSAVHIAHMGLLGYGYAGLLALGGLAVALGGFIARRLEVGPRWAADSLVSGGVQIIGAAIFAAVWLGF